MLKFQTAIGALLQITYALEQDPTRKSSLTLDFPQQLTSEKIVLDEDGNEVALKQLLRIERPKPKGRDLKETDYTVSPTECKTATNRIKNDMIDYNDAIH